MLILLILATFGVDAAAVGCADGGLTSAGVGFEEGSVAAAAVPPAGLGERFGAKIFADEDGVY